MIKITVRLKNVKHLSEFLTDNGYDHGVIMDGWEISLSITPDALFKLGQGFAEYLKVKNGCRADRIAKLKQNQTLFERGLITTPEYLNFIKEYTK